MPFQLRFAYYCLIVSGGRIIFGPDTKTVPSLEQDMAFPLNKFCVYSVCTFGGTHIVFVRSVRSIVCPSVTKVCAHNSSYISNGNSTNRCMIVYYYIEIRISLRQFDRTTYEGVNVFLTQNILSKCLHAESQHFK